MFRYFIIPLVVFLMFSSSAIADSERRDGNWWRSEQHVNHIDYVLGILDGMSLGNKFSYWKDNATYTKKEGLDMQKIADNYNYFATKYVANVSDTQFVDGLNEFYKDYRNRRILINLAMWLVANEIAGKPKNDMDKMIESFRKNAQ